MNKYIVLIILFLFSSQSNWVFGQNRIKWLSWEEAIEKSKKDKKKIFIYVYTEWCGWCKKMDKTTFSEDHIARYVNANYYAIKFDAEMKTPVTLKGKTYNYIKSGNSGYHELAAFILQNKMSYPSMIFMDEDVSIIQAIPGYQDNVTFEMIITYFGGNSHKSIPWHKYMNLFVRDEYFNSPVNGKN